MPVVHVGVGQVVFGKQATVGPVHVVAVSA